MIHKSLKRIKTHNYLFLMLKKLGDDIELVFRKIKEEGNE
jgi:hypothetical protein